MTFNLGISLPNFESEFNKNINLEINKIIKKNIGRVISNIEKRLQERVRKSISDSEEVQSIRNGQLTGELGIVATSNIDVIIEQFSQSVEVKYLPKGKFGTIVIRIIESDYSDVLSLPESSYIYSSRGGRSGIIEWLRWLLLEGRSTIVAGYDFQGGGGGRTGRGIMVKRQNEGWSIPSRFAGTASDNFVTRSLANIDDEIENIIRQEITKGFK